MRQRDSKLSDFLAVLGDITNSLLAVFNLENERVGYILKVEA